MVYPRIFGPFMKMIQRLPAKAIIRALEIECGMIQTDFERNRYALTEEAISILYFREFVQMARFGGVVYFARPIPEYHCEFYRQTLVRLIEANELPPRALEEFDHHFAPVRLSLAA